MTSMLVRPKAMTEVHPQHVRQKYEEYQRANPSSDRWCIKFFRSGVRSMKGCG